MIPLLLRQVTAVSDTGLPTLAGENRRVIAVQAFRAEDVGRLAACQEVASEEDAVLALGIISDEPNDDAAPQPLILKSGDSSLILAPDGSIRIEGRSFGLRTKGAIKLKGATVDLN